MLSWLFKKRGGVVVAVTGAALDAPAQAPARAVKARQAEDARAEWAARLQSAQGNNEALLLVARAAPLLDIRCAAVEALGTEDALKRAERELRGHDSRVHRVAKLRLVAAVAQREARARATALIDTATVLAGDALLPANRLVALDRDWQALDASLLSAAHCTAFSELRDRINASVRKQGEQQHRVHRWAAEARQALTEMQLGATEAADDMTRRCEAATRVRECRPEVPATAALDEALQAALEAARRTALQPALESALESVPESAARAEAARGATLTTLEVSGPESKTSAASSTGPMLPRIPTPEQRQQLDALLCQAEAALTGGQLGEMQRHLHAVDAALQGFNGAALDDRLRARRQALHAERSRLRDWQQWGGAQAIDALVAEAVELAGLTLAAAHPDPDAGAAPKLHLKAHAASIHALRLRWNEIGRLGAMADQPLWHRFDAALQTAHQPVAAQQSAMKAARLENLQAREALLDALDALPAPPAAPHTDDTAAHWKVQLRGLAHFQLAWRQLGPVEHTVPAGARGALLQRQRSGVERIEAPLREARRAAEAMREQLIVRVDTLASDGLASEPGRNPALRDAALRDATQRVRELQAEWQQQARMLPLARAVEGALWARFKAATDAVFAQREAAFSARDSELAANLAAREALLDRLSSLDGEASPDEVQRTLAEVDRAWRQPMELPNAAAGVIDARFRSARAAVAQALADSHQRAWQGRCDTLLAKLLLCEKREAAPPGEHDLASRWAAHDALPPAWEQALELRWSQAVAPGPLTEAAMEDLLLQLEAAFDLPTAPELQAARRDLKLRALKDAFEGRGAPAVDPASQRAQWLAAAVRQSVPTAALGERLRAVIAALRRSPAGLHAIDAPSR